MDSIFQFISVFEPINSSVGNGRKESQLKPYDPCSSPGEIVHVYVVKLIA